MDVEVAAVAGGWKGEGDFSHGGFIQRNLVGELAGGGVAVLLRGGANIGGERGRRHEGEGTRERL